jgi:hypothetical protein
VRASRTTEGMDGPSMDWCRSPAAPNCPWLEPLVRLRCKRGTTKKCTFFIWIEDYIEKLQSDGMLKGARIMGESQEMVMSN